MEPASIRYKNPGAMWGNAIAIKWGAAKKAVVLKDGKGQGNNIAVFPTFVQGICAQLDLWRTSKNYRDKRFADAIAIWSGHNEVPSYIAFCKKRVPGLTENTIMGDAFWHGPMGIAFLKAQAWHEAGKQYPAPDPDWIEAQKRVFDGGPAEIPVVDRPVVPPPQEPVETPINIQPSETPYSVDVEIIQKTLTGLHYYEVGTIDGIAGGKFVAGVAAFMTDRGKDPNKGRITDDLKQELGKAVSEGWSRPIAPSRANATEKDIAPKMESVRQSLWQRLGAKITGGGALVTAAISEASNQISAVNSTISPVKQFFTDVPGWVWLLLVCAMALALWYSANRSTNASVKDFNSGKIN